MIAASNVSLSIGTRLLLRGVNFCIQPGELVAVIGPNGVGKTTLLRAIAGLHQVVAGTIEINGRPVQGYTSVERARKIAFMVSDDSAVDAVSVRDAVAAGRYAHHRWWDWRELQSDTVTIEGALEAVQMSAFATRAFQTLSTGERQRIWLAQGLAQEAPILLLDEPTSHLDMKVSQEILGLLRIQARSGKTVVCVVHDINEALEFADRLMVLGHEALLAADTPEAILKHGTLDDAYGIRLEVVRTRAGALRVFPAILDYSLQAPTETDT